MGGGLVDVGGVPRRLDVVAYSKSCSSVAFVGLQSAGNVCLKCSRLLLLSTDAIGTDPFHHSTAPWRSKLVVTAPTPDLLLFSFRRQNFATRATLLGERTR